MEMSRSLLQKLLGCSVSLGLLILLSTVSFLDAQAPTTAITAISLETGEILSDGLTEQPMSTLPQSEEKFHKRPSFLNKPSEQKSPPGQTPFPLSTASFLGAQAPTIAITAISPETDVILSDGLTEQPMSTLPQSEEKFHKRPSFLNKPSEQKSPPEQTPFPLSTASFLGAQAPTIAITAISLETDAILSDGLTEQPMSTLPQSEEKFHKRTSSVNKPSRNTTVSMIKSTLAPGKTTVMGSSPELHPRGKPGQSTKGRDKTTVHTPHDTKIYTSNSGPGFWSTTLMTPMVVEGTDPAPRGSTPSTNRVKLIAAIVLPLLLLFILLLLFVYCRRRHRSGSTSFGAASWAGQARVPDDSGLEKEAEQGTVMAGAGEGDSRRDTLVTFVGKRQSRVPSVAMEELSKKEDGVENQKLLDGPADTGSSPEGDGKLNGKLLESCDQSSQETLPPLGPASQDS